MNTVERFRAVLDFKAADRLPVIEWAGWWDQTVARWRGEGLPAALADAGAIREYFGQDCHRQYWIGAHGPTCPAPTEHGAALADDMAGYEALRPHLFPQVAFDADTVRAWAPRHAAGDMAVWITLEGFFWFPRTLLGIERHLYAFYDHPELMHRINTDLLEFNLRVLDEFCRICTPEFMTFAEDMSYNHGPMISKELFDQFMAPYYRRIVPDLKRRGITPLVDSDGDVMPIIPWLEEVGLEGLLPLERMAGVDVAELRRRHPRFRMVGAFDKTVMKNGGSAMRREFERLLPVMRTGGYIPSVDHQTPPDVSLETYRVFVRLLEEYAGKGVMRG